MIAALQQAPELADVASDQLDQGLQMTINVDRQAAARLGVTMSRHRPDAVRRVRPAPDHHRLFAADPVPRHPGGRPEIPRRSRRAGQDLRDDGQRPMPPRAATSPTASARGFHQASPAIPLSAFAHIGHGMAPLAITHQGLFPATTISFNLADGVSLGQAVAALHRARAGHRAARDGDDQPRRRRGRIRHIARSAKRCLMLAAIVTVYIVLGVLYESFIHPITILSTLPSAGVGALLALMICGQDLDLISLIGIILLIGIVKKNAIMMVDFALDAERERGETPLAAIRQACILRFRPIMMTTMAALFGALPLALGAGTGSELRRPHGHRHRRRPARLAIPHALHHAGDLSRLRLDRQPQLAHAHGTTGARQPRPPCRDPVRPLHPAAGGDPAALARRAAAGRRGLCACCPSPPCRTSTGRPSASMPPCPARAPTPSPPRSPSRWNASSAPSPASSRCFPTAARAAPEITIQFDLDKDIDAAAGAVQAAINAAGPNLPKDLPQPPVYWKANPCRLRGDRAGHDLRHRRPQRGLRLRRQRRRREDSRSLPGVARVKVSGRGAQRGAHPGAAPPARQHAALAGGSARGDQGRDAEPAQGRHSPIGDVSIRHRRQRPVAEGGGLSRTSWWPIATGAAVRLGDVANVTDSVINDKLAGWYGNRARRGDLCLQAARRQRGADRRCGEGDAAGSAALAAALGQDQRRSTTAPP